MDASPPPGMIMAAGAVWPPICAAMVGLRFYARRSLNAPILWDDWLAIPALILLWGLGATIVAGTALKAIGYPTPAPSAGQTAKTNNAFEVQITRGLLWAFELIQFPMLGCVKLSFVIFYRRIFCSGHGNMAFSIATIIIGILVVIWTIGLEFGMMFVCGTRFSAWWTSVQDDNIYCPGTLKFQNAMAISDSITDIILFILPIPLLYRLRMSTRRKLAVTAVFCMGLITIAASLTRMVIFIKAIQVDFTAHQDNDLLISGAMYWSMNESGFALVSVCLPTLYGLIKLKLFGKRNVYIKTDDVDTSYRSQSMIGPTGPQLPMPSTTSDICLYACASEHPPIGIHVVPDGITHGADPELGQIRVTNDVHVESERWD